MFSIRHSNMADVDGILEIDKYIPRCELEKKIASRPEQIYIINLNNLIIGVLRYSIFWDYIPYVCFLKILEDYCGKGYAKKALTFWEDAMRNDGWPVVMTSIPSNDPAQNFYRKMGYKDAGCLCVEFEPYAQPTELFFMKSLKLNLNANN